MKCILSIDNIRFKPYNPVYLHKMIRSYLAMTIISPPQRIEIFTAAPQECEMNYNAILKAIDPVFGGQKDIAETHIYNISSKKKIHLGKPKTINGRIIVLAETVDSSRPSKASQKQILAAMKRIETFRAGKPVKPLPKVQTRKYINDAIAHIVEADNTFDIMSNISYGNTK